MRTAEIPIDDVVCPSIGDVTETLEASEMNDAVTSHRNRLQSLLQRWTDAFDLAQRRSSDAICWTVIFSVAPATGHFGNSSLGSLTQNVRSVAATFADADVFRLRPRHSRHRHNIGNAASNFQKRIFQTDGLQEINFVTTATLLITCLCTMPRSIRRNGRRSGTD